MVEELTDEQLQAFERRLKTLKQDLQARLDATEMNDDGNHQAGSDSVARLNAVQEQAMATASRKQYQSQLRGVLKALAAIDTGDYGFCQQCDEPIPAARLEIQPESLLCVRCQSRRESA